MVKARWQDEQNKRKVELVKAMEVDAVFEMFANEHGWIGREEFRELMTVMNFDPYLGPRGVIRDEQGLD